MTSEEYRIIGEIAKRAFKLTGSLTSASQMDYFMDFCAVVEGGTPLDLQKLLAFDDENFAHDVIGVHLTLNHTTKKLDGEFCPRCAK